MKKIIFIFCLVSSFLAASDLEKEVRVVPFNFTFVPGYNFISGDHKTIVAAGFISSNIYELNGVQVAPIFSTTASGADGVQASGIFNVNRGDSDGIQLAGVYNQTVGNFYGIQGSGYVNVINGELFDGVQVAGLHNTSKDLDGVQVSGFSNLSKDIDGVQLAAAVNIGKNIDGVQGAGAVNYAKDVDGIQLAGAVNIGKNIDGLQGAGAFNYAKEVDGFQISGLLNVANNLNGVQIGVINIVTQSSNNSVPIGILNLYKDGIRDIVIWADHHSWIYAGIETGSKNVYTQIYAGTERENISDPEYWIYGAGFGCRLFSQSFINFDFVAGAKYEHEYKNSEHYSYWSPDLKATAAIKLSSLSVFAGVSGNIMIEGHNEDASYFRDRDSVNIDEDLDLFYNYIAGVKISL